MRAEDARRAIALTLVWAYLALLFLSVLLPILLYWKGPGTDAAKISAIKDMSGPLTAGFASVTGVIGFVLGYYFKSEEKREM